MMIWIGKKRKKKGVRGKASFIRERAGGGSKKMFSFKTSLSLSFFLSTHLCANRVPDEQGAHEFEAVVHRGEFFGLLLSVGKKREKRTRAIGD